MKNNAFLICILVFFIHLQCMGQELYDYRLSVDKRNMDAASIHAECLFTLNFQESDSACLNLGGHEDLSLENLLIQGESFKYQLDKTHKKITFYRINNTIINVRLSYDYTNLSSFITYGKGDAEIWETSYDEHYYPYIVNKRIDADIEFFLPDSLELIAAYPMVEYQTGRYSKQIKKMLGQSLSFAFIRKKAYTKTIAAIPDTIPIYQLKGMSCKKERYEELLELTKASIEYFSSIFKEAYFSDLMSIRSYPIYLFHNGEGFSNRNNIGFISASQEKFSTYPDIYPLVHEIGHRWLGEWSLLIDDGQPGAYFIKESLNEFMELMFIRNYLGVEAYEKQLELKRKKYQTIKNTKSDTPLIEMKYNNNNIVVYEKGPLLLEEIAQQIGYNNLIDVIVRFYKKHTGLPSLHIENFMEVLRERFPTAAQKLDFLIRQ